jgi:hypothetical protein
MHKIKGRPLHLQEDSELFLSRFFPPHLPLFFTLRQLETSVANPVCHPREGTLSIVFSTTPSPPHHPPDFLKQIIMKSSLRVRNEVTVDEGEVC